MKSNKRKSFNRILNLILLLSIAFVSYNVLSTYAYLTNGIKDESHLNLGDMDSSILINGDENLNIIMDDLMYLNNDIEEINNLDEYGSILNVYVQNTSILKQKIKVNITHQEEGLFYIICDKETKNYGELIRNEIGNNTKEKIANYNFNYQKTLYENQIYNPTDIFEFKIIYFAIYDYLSVENKIKYSGLSFKTTLSIRCVQYHENGEYIYE